MHLHINCINCTSIAHYLHISDVFRTFIGHTYWHLLGISGDYLAVGKSNKIDANVAYSRAKRMSIRGICEADSEVNCEKGNESNDWEMKKNKKTKINAIILKSFIVFAVVIMLLSVTPGQGSKNITKITERLIFRYNRGV